MPNIDHRKLRLRKQDALVELLRTHASVYVHVDTRVPGVMAPKKLLGQPQVAFQLGSNLAVPIQELTIHDEGWSAVMAFGPNRTAAKCIFPWKAVYFIVGDSGIGANWPLDTPHELLAKIEAAPEKPAGKAPGTAKRTLPSGWKVIEGGAAGKKAEPEPPPTGPHAPRGYRRKPLPPAG